MPLVYPYGFLTLSSSAYQITRSLRFNSADTAYLSKTVGAAATDGKKFTVSLWLKRSKFGVDDPVVSSNNLFLIRFNTSHQLRFALDESTGSAYVSTAVFRDPSAWYHFVFVLDTTLAAGADRAKVYCNGTQISITWNSIGSQNAVTEWNQNTNTQQVGAYVVGSMYSNDYFAEIYNIDGQALDQTYFGETDATTGAWKPKAYTGTYGTNGFYLTFSDNSNTTAATLGADDSGNGNNWTPNNFSVSAGVGNDSLVDTPTNYGTDTGAGGEVRGNYCTWNPLFASTDTQPVNTNGNLDISSATQAYRQTRGTVQAPAAASGVVKWEYTTNSGVNGTTQEATLGFVDPATGTVYSVNGSGITSLTTNDVVSFSLDRSTGVLTFYRNGSALSGGAQAPVTGVPAVELLPYARLYNVSGSANFGQRAWAYSAAPGKALCTQNLPTPAIAKSSSYFDVLTYTGNGSGSMAQRDITGLNFQPDYVDIKGRSGATAWAKYDSVRGVTKDFDGAASAQTTETTGLTAFNSNGFGIKELAKINTNAATYVAACWKEGATPGLDIVSFTGTGAQQSVSHNLSVTPRMYWFRKNTALDSVWFYHADMNASPHTGAMFMEGTQAFSASPSYFGSVAPSSSIFSVGLSAANTVACTAWVWVEVEGFSRIRNYTGNAAADGPFVWCGFRPRFVLIKSSTAVDAWLIYDSARDTYNVMPTTLVPNTAAAEAAISGLDFLSNGFKLRTITTTPNAAQTYVFAAFAESPFKTARAR